MDTYELLRTLVEILERLEIRYFVTGSMASIFYGEPRFTNDIDIVADLPIEKVDIFCGAFPEDEYYVSADSARQAVLKKRQFNIIHPSSGLKVDLMIPSRSTFDEERFRRARHIHPSRDLRAIFATPEDVILKKMAFFKEGGSDKHLRDISGIVSILGSDLDRSYIEDWAKRLDLMEIWEAIEKKSRK